ncbi:MAG: aromatic ring-hydroxylating dioxygenase subunit alpha [Spirochaetales bacterium]|nr:aromatic ring-hydroxylating dioxygenase subunit alpha [Spirochaetales bacterium]
MIPNQWYAILESKEVKKGRMIGVTRMGEKLSVWRGMDDRVAVISDLCAHRGASLSCGKLHPDGVTCPFHAFKYDNTGRCISIPANGKTAPVPENFKVRSYAVEEKQGFIFIFWGERRDNLPPVPFFEDLDAGFLHGSRQDPWKTHYSRAIENQLDVVHVPIVHYNTIGRGNKTLVDGPKLEVNREQLYIKYYNRVDDGRPPVKDEALPPVDRKKIHLHFIYPNIWQNWISEKLRIMIAFAPVDDQNTILYIRIYQKIMKLPVLSRFVNWLFLKFSLVVAHQDRRVVETQRPFRSTYKMQENLIQGDNPVIAYRRLRDELINSRALP